MCDLTGTITMPATSRIYPEVIFTNLNMLLKVLLHYFAILNMQGRKIDNVEGFLCYAILKENGISFGSLVLTINLRQLVI
jgi:ABC-type amino acid transport system permease subunit